MFPKVTYKWFSTVLRNRRYKRWRTKENSLEVSRELKFLSTTHKVEDGNHQKCHWFYFNQHAPTLGIFSYCFQLGNLPATRVGLDHLARCLIIRKGHPSWFIPSILLCFYQNSYLLYLVVYYLSTATKLQDYRRLGFIFRFLSFPSLLCSQSLKRSLSHSRQAPKK